MIESSPHSAARSPDERLAIAEELAQIVGHEAVFIDDRRCLHGATPISPTDGSTLAVRDTLIVTYHSVSE